MIFITGATGMIGKELIPLLKDEVTCLVRKPTKIKGIKTVVGDLLKPETYKKELRKSKIVVHLAAEINERSKTLWETNVIGTKKLIETMGNQHIVFASTTGIYGETPNASEKSMPDPETLYEKSKLAAENIVTNSGKKYTIIRPTMVIGPSTYWLKFLKIAKKNWPVIGGKNHFHTIHVKDVANAFARSITKKLYNEDFIIASEKPKTLLETYEIMKKELGVKKKTYKINISIMLLMSKITQYIPGTLLTPQYIHRLTRERVYDIRKSIKLGIKSKYSTEEAIEYTVNEFRKKGEL